MLERLDRVAEDFLAFCREFDSPLYDWQAEAFGEATRREAGRFVYPLAGVSAPRGNGKSVGAANVGGWRLVSGPPPQLVLSVALDLEGAKVVMEHARAMFRRHPALAAAVDVRADSLVVPSTGSRWLVRSRDHESSRGLHPDVVIYDECGWAKDDELFASLLSSQASVSDPFMLVVSTVGRLAHGPLWRIKMLAESAA